MNKESDGSRSMKKIFITGAGSGIGRATARLFARSGWFVGLYDVNAESVLALRGEIGEDHSCARSLDVVNSDDVKSAIGHFLDHGGAELHALFNCAGILHTGPFEEIALEDHHRTLDVNARGILNCCYHALKPLKATEGSCVINMCSGSAFFGSPDHVVYSATKFWVRGFTEALNIEWARFGIRVSDVMPPYVDTPMIANARPIQTMERLGVEMSADQVAETVWRAAHGNKIHWIIGWQATMNYHAARLLPIGLIRFVAKRTTGY